MLESAHCPDLARIDRTRVRVSVQMSLSVGSEGCGGSWRYLRVSCPWRSEFGSAVSLRNCDRWESGIVFRNPTMCCKTNASRMHAGKRIGQTSLVKLYTARAACQEHLKVTSSQSVSPMTSSGLILMLVADLAVWISPLSLLSFEVLVSTIPACSYVRESSCLPPGMSISCWWQCIDLDSYVTRELCATANSQVEVFFVT
jgi:hypothetical protein